ncbi:MAG: PIN domain-containing protein [Melioribacteraceae bacterium]
MSVKIEYLIDTDILISHLMTKNFSELSDLESAMIRGICFTSVLNLTELYFIAGSPEEKSGIDSVARALKVLGIHPRYSLNITEFFNKVATARDALFCSLAKNNKLPILTGDSERYRDSGIKIISPNELRG